MSKSVSTKKMKKTKRFVSARNVDSERSGEGSSWNPSQDSQDLSVVAVAAPLITEKSSETQSVDVTNKDTVNRYLRCEDTCTVQKHKEFEREGSFSGLL